MNCKCGGKFGANDPKDIKYIVCQSCKARVYKEAYGGTFSKKEMMTLLSGEEIYKQLRSAKGKDYFAWCSYNHDAKKLEIDFNKPGPIVFECACGGPVRDHGILYKCEECEAKMMKTIAEVKISKKDAERIFAGERVLVEDFVSKKNIKENEENRGKEGYEKKSETFSAFVVLQKGDWTTFDFNFDIDDEENKEDSFLSGEDRKKDRNMDEGNIDVLNDLFFSQAEEYEDDE